MLALNSAKEVIENLERRLSELEKQISEKQLLIDELNEKKDEKVKNKKEKELFPSIGELVSREEDDNEEDEEMNETGMRTTQLGVTEIESLCMNCHKNGLTRLLLTKIPYFQEVILMAFSCPYCGFRDTQIKPGGSVQEKGHKITLKCHSLQDLSRQIVKSDSCSLRIEEIDFEVPASRGVVSNIEGMIVEAIESLSETQAERLNVSGAEAFKQVGDFIEKLKDVSTGKILPLTVVLNDPTGNSFIDNPRAPLPDPNLKIQYYIRTPAQCDELGLQPSTSSNTPKNYKTGSVLDKNDQDIKSHFTSEEVLSIPAHCPECQKEGNADTSVINLPFFKDVIVMAFCCEFCGFRDTEIKGGGAIPKQGRLDTLKVTNFKVDLARDVIKSDTAGVSIPELQLELTRGSLGGMYTTVEGLMMKMKENLFGNRMLQGDSFDWERRKRFDELEEHFDACIEGRMEFTVIIQDPLANSYIYSPFDPPSSDPRLTFECYDRSWEEDEELGLHDMNVDAVEFPAVESNDIAEKAMAHLQIGQKDTHPNAFAKGGD